MYEEMIRTQVTDEIKNVKDMLAGVVGLLDKNVAIQSKVEQKQADLES